MGNVESRVQLEDISQGSDASIPSVPGKPGLGRSSNGVLSQLIGGFSRGVTPFAEQRGNVWSAHDDVRSDRTLATWAMTLSGH